MKGEFKHIKSMLEREVVLRSAKHVFNQILREESGDTQLYTANVICHLLNCLFAPHDFLAKLNAQEIRPVDTSV